MSEVTPVVAPNQAQLDASVAAAKQSPAMQILMTAPYVASPDQFVLPKLKAPEPEPKQAPEEPPSAPVDVKHLQYVEREKLTRAYSPNGLPLLDIFAAWRAVKPLSATADRKRKLMIRTLKLFKPEQMFHLTVGEFRKSYAEFGNNSDAMKLLYDMNAEKLLCFASVEGTFIYEPSVNREGITKAHLWLTAEGVQAWAQAMVDTHREAIRANPKLSGLLTEFLVEHRPHVPLPKEDRKA